MGVKKSRDKLLVGKNANITPNFILQHSLSDIIGVAFFAYFA
jgi:hypothetical protein